VDTPFDQLTLRRTQIEIKMTVLFREAWQTRNIVYRLADATSDSE